MQKNISPISTTIFIHKEFLQPHVQYRLSEIFTVALEWSKNSLRFDQVHTLQKSSWYEDHWRWFFFSLYIIIYIQYARLDKTILRSLVVILISLGRQYNKSGGMQIALDTGRNMR